MGARWGLIGVDDFTRTFSADVAPLPGNVCLLGWCPDRGWLISGTQMGLLHDRLDSLIKFWDGHLRPRLPGGPFWFVCCLWDGWRERTEFSDDYRFVEAPEAGAHNEWVGQPGAIPVLSRGRPVIACFAAHRGDPSSLLLPDAHYLRNFYRLLLIRVALARRPWTSKHQRAVFCGADHGEALNQVPPIQATRPFARRHLKQIVEAEGLPVDVHLGAGVGLTNQIRYKHILDVDGEVRTWDAWAWKARSGSVLISQASIWETFFTRQFRPWDHFVPVENDFSDLGEKLAWCAEHDAECRQIAQRARAHAARIYDPGQAAEATAAALRVGVFGQVAAL